MTGEDVLALGLLLVGGFLVGGAYTTWGRSRLVAGILGVLAALALAGALLRLVPTA